MLGVWSRYYRDIGFPRGIGSRHFSKAAEFHFGLSGECKPCSKPCGARSVAA